MIVVDTNVVSEIMKPSPAIAVTHWLDGENGADLYTTSITVAEVLYGIERLPVGRRKELLRATAVEVFAAFEHQVLAFDENAAVDFAWIVDRRERLGNRIDGFDAQIAAICRTHGATLATRNVKDFLDAGIEVVDPWSTP